MSKPRPDRDYLLDMEDAVRRILVYTAGLTWNEFAADLKTQDAVIRNLEVIGEATKNLSDIIRSQNPELPWRDMAGARPADASLFWRQPGDRLADR